MRSRLTAPLRDDLKQSGSRTSLCAVLLVLLLWLSPASGDRLRTSYIDTLVIGPSSSTVIVRADSGNIWQQNHRLTARTAFVGWGQDADLVKLLLLWREYREVECGDDRARAYGQPLRRPGCGEFYHFMSYLERRIVVADSLGTK